MPRVTSPRRPVLDPLSIAALDTERYVAGAGWDQAPDALTAIEQEGLHQSSNLESVLGRVAWPPDVDGCAFVVERVVVPPDAERDLPSDPDAAVEALARHPDREDVRLLAAVLRDGTSVCLIRQRSHDADDAVGTGPDLAPGLVAALQATFDD
jgi:hypothetical protein